MDFDHQVQVAIAHPEEADLQELWAVLMRHLERLPQSAWLEVAGSAIAQIAEVYALRAKYLLDAWDSRYGVQEPEFLSLEALVEPVLTDEMLAGFLRHTMMLNIEDLLEQADPQHRGPRSPEDSIVREMPKEEIFQTLEEATRAALNLASEEKVSEWSAQVRNWIATQPQPVSLTAVLQGVGLSPVRTWLGLLLADPSYHWQTQWNRPEEFYSPEHTWIQSKLIETSQRRG